MKKNINTKYKVNNTAADIIILLLLLLIAGAALCFFWKDLNRSLTRDDMQPIAYVTFKHNSAQRKFSDRMIWDRLKQKSDVYNYDTIRTADKSEATLHFPDESTLDIDENTLIQIYVNENGETMIDVSTGKLNMSTGETAKPVTIKSGKNKVIVKQNSTIKTVVQATTSSDGTIEPNSFQVEVNGGRAAVTTPAGAEQSLSTGDAIAMDNAGNAAVIEGVTVLKPGSSEQVLSFTGEPQNIDFAWKNHSSDRSLVIVEIATDPLFGTIATTKTVEDEESCTLSLAVGTYWWRIYTASSEKSETGKIEIVDAGPVTPLAPADEAQYSYRKNVPSVRLSWSENTKADAYELKVSTQSDLYSSYLTQELTRPGFVLDNLPEGTYYWSVTPHFAFDTEGQAHASAIRSFSIVHKEALIAPVLIAPAPDAFVDYAGKQKVSLSWKESVDAQRYTVTVFADKSLTKPIITQETAMAWCTVADTSLFRPGRYYWTVTLTDSEGSVSPQAEVRSFIATNGPVVQENAFPPDRYTVQADRSDNLTYRWNSNVPFATTLQIASDRTFKNIIYAVPATAHTKSGLNLRAGTYYWRLHAKDESNVTVDSTPYQLTVMPQLPAPVVQFPVDGKKYILKHNGSLTCAWQPVNGAGYYAVTLTDSANRTVFARDALFQTQFTIETHRLQKGTYTLTVRPFTDKTDRSSFRSGAQTACSFIMVQPNPVKLLAPLQDSTIDGISAALSPASAEWDADHKAVQSYFILSRTRTALPASFDKAQTVERMYNGKLTSKSGLLQTGEPVVMCVHNPESALQLVSLAPGTYYWTVCALDKDGGDLTPETCRSFTVSPVQQLAAPSLTAPDADRLFDAEAIIKSHTITFTWDAVPDATTYTFTLYSVGVVNGAKKQLLTRSIASGESRSAQADMVDLNEGTFLWTVRADRYIEGNYRLQSGTTAERTFTIDLPDMGAPVVDEPEGILYGQ